jgi:hypothetical protein
MLVGGGFLPGQMIVIGARPSMGKTALACQIADCAATHETGTAFFTLEMPDRSILLRMAAARAQAQRHGTYETYLTAIVAPTCDCDPPMLRLIGTANRLRLLAAPPHSLAIARQWNQAPIPHIAAFQ